MGSRTATSTFSHRSQYRCSPGELYRWHSRPGALQRLLPPWQKTEVLHSDNSIEPGSTVQLKMQLGPVPTHISARHLEAVPERMFADTLDTGPFRHWLHRHYFTASETGSELHDLVEYSLPGHRLLPAWLHRRVEKELERLFAHRQMVLGDDLTLHQSCATRPLTILISGASGVLGRDLVPLLTTGGHRVVSLVRRPPVADTNEVFWDPEGGRVELDSLPPIDGVIHLAGEYIGLSRWSTAKKRRVLRSRVRGTEVLVRALLTLPQPPPVFLCASAVGYYGDCGDDLAGEEQDPGPGFISEVCARWEQASAPLVDRGVRTVLLRLGVGLTPRGGALQRILGTAALGFPRAFGSGRQYISWISSDDMIGAIVHALCCDSLHGAVNIAAPQPVTNTRFMETLARLYGKPLLPPVPAAFLQLLYGQMAREILLSGCRVATDKLTRSGYRFRHPTLDSALQFLLGIKG